MVAGQLSTIESLDCLGRLGINTAIDDFRTGYSSLSYLRKLQCSVLKIDQSFVHDIESDAKAAGLAHSISTMTHNHQLGVVAEGVETTAPLAILRDFGHDMNPRVPGKPPGSARGIQGVVESRMCGGDRHRRR